MSEKVAGVLPAEPRRVPVPDNVQKTYGKGLCTRAVAAHILGISKSELIRREKDGVYPHVRDDAGVVWYTESDMRKIAGAKGEKEKSHRLREVREGKRNAGYYSAETASVVFGELNRGKPLDEIIVQAAVHPEAALAIQVAYGRVKGGLYLSKEDLEALSRLPFRAAWPPKEGKDLVRALEGALAGARCHRCKERPARLCSTCIAAVVSDEAPVAKAAGANGANGLR
jgi:hypothetical protein